MKINPFENNVLISSNKPELKPGADARTAGVAPEPSATVALSAQARAAQGTSATADFDAEKVNRIAQAIRDGSFKINADAIANKLIEHASEYVGRRPQ